MGILSDTGRRRAEEFRSQLRQFHGATDGVQAFTVDPARAQEIHLLMAQDASPYLGLIDNQPRSDMRGDVLYMGDSGLVSSRTNTAAPGTERTLKSVHSLDKNTYDMYPVERDIKIGYSVIDSWSHLPNFMDVWAAMVRRAIGNDILRVGWNGTSYAASTDMTTYPQGQDVAKGWLELARDSDSAEDYYVDGSGGEVALGSEEFPNLDYIVATTKGRVHVVYRNDPNLVAIVSQNLIDHEEQQFYKQNGRKPTEKSKLLENGIIVKTYGGLPAYSPPFLPDGVVGCTTWKNLQRLFQPSSMRRKVEDKPELNAYADWNSDNECYAIGDYRAFALVDGITIEETQPLE
ncbi:phage major capsid protein, P2 family [Methylomagnum ishizawai]|uniref:Phage major capsid protein, P2 family n=1 Tax=Methylomagnum ishizawai TaxID=1760988 RepID=A0A1Y6CUT9_9GAMM|nr:P2 family phage major capsid protein [Methylomagnum ishizawai]SMF94419.1 phage major capsid protein, P2 family [Methylomagnum ishizawai]